MCSQNIYVPGQIRKQGTSNKYPQPVFMENKKYIHILGWKSVLSGAMTDQHLPSLHIPGDQFSNGEVWSFVECMFKL